MFWGTWPYEYKVTIFYEIGKKDILYFIKIILHEQQYVYEKEKRRPNSFNIVT